MKVAAYQRQARAGIELLIKRLEKMADDADKISHVGVAQTARRDKESLEAMLAANPELPLPETAKKADRTVIRTGLTLLCTNLKAAAGTVKALGKVDFANDFIEEAKDIEQHVLPQLDEQPPLRLESAGGE
jgi:hypothetical protein